MYSNARRLNDHLLEKAIQETGTHNTLLDVGCWDGVLTKRYQEMAGAKHVYGIELVSEMAQIASQKGIHCVSMRADVDRWPFDDESIDCITSNQVIEHLSNVDHFFSEAARTLKKGGVLITSTNNLASLHNIGALVLGWSPFDLSNSSVKVLGLGNPLAVHAGESDHAPSWTHKCIYTPRWLFDWMKVYGLQRVSLRGAGFYPFPARLGNVFKNHGAFMILTARKYGVEQAI